jgi:hypothetical protein
MITSAPPLTQGRLLDSLEIVVGVLTRHAQFGERLDLRRRPCLEEAVAAYREALKEKTRERVPLQWAMTQNNLGKILATFAATLRGEPKEI